MISRRRNLSQWLALAPWWTSVLISVGTFILLQYVLPPLLDNNDAEASGQVLRFWSPYIAILLIIPLPFALFHQDEYVRLVENERNLDILRGLKHADFVERMVPAFRQQGYLVEHVTDARYDLMLRRSGERTIVTCKAWDASVVGVRFVRQVQAAQHAQHAAGAKIVTCGEFSPQAQRFKRTSSVELIDGAQVLALLAAVRERLAAADEMADELDTPLAPPRTRPPHDLLQRR